MSNGLLVLILLQWAGLIGLALLVVALFRQVGLLHERLGPVGALTLPGGVKAGDDSPRFTLRSLTGGDISIGGPTADGRSMLLFFLSSTCPVCKEVLPTLLSLAREYRDQAHLVLASDGDEVEMRAFIRARGLEALPFVLSSELGRSLGVGKLPYAVLLSAGGKVVTKGLVNNREHIESLFEAERLGVVSLQDYAARRQHS